MINVSTVFASIDIRQRDCESMRVRYAQILPCLFLMHICPLPMCRSMGGGGFAKYKVFGYQFKKTFNYGRVQSRIWRKKYAHYRCLIVFVGQLADGCYLMPTKCSSQLSLYMHLEGFLKKKLFFKSKHILYWRVKKFACIFLYLGIYLSLSSAY